MKMLWKLNYYFRFVQYQMSFNQFIWDDNYIAYRSQIEHVSDHPESAAKSWIWIKYFYFI